MLTLTVDDNVAPFEVLPANGTAGVTVTPRSSSSGGGAIAKVNLFTNSGQVNFASGDSADLFNVAPVCTGNALRISWNAVAGMILGAGSNPGFGFTLTVDGTDVPELEPSVGYVGPGTPGNSTVPVSATFWVLGVAPGTHTVVLNASFAGATAATGSIAANSSLVVEDWALTGG